MKILPISISNTNIRKYNNTKISNPVVSVETKTPEKYFSLYFGRDLVLDNKKDFNKTLKENYFKLPEGCNPDDFQIEAGKAILQGKNVMVEAPTGTGKTAIAHYAVSNNIREGKTTFYTTPLKALSNQKLNEFRNIYGNENVGILTGDRRENTEAPIIIMTTEVYRNMVLSSMYGEKSPLLDNLGTVIFDEFHYLGDLSRGSTWEESLMYTPKGVQTLELSATIGNPQTLKNWISALDETKETNLVSIPSEARYVPLKFDYFYTRSYEEEEKRIKKACKQGRYNGEATNYDIKTKPALTDFKSAIDSLSSAEKLPVIFFVFSRKYSRELLQYLAVEGKDLTSKSEKEEIEKIVEKYKSKKYIGADLDLNALKKGYAIHNAGIIPAQKELIEELFQKKLIKTVISTETLAAGINMPARTVVISSPYKPCDEENEDSETNVIVKNRNCAENKALNVRLLTPNEFKQMSGRAGRRGIDSIGYVYTMPTNRNSEQEFLSLEVLASNPINSRYNPDYSFLTGYYEHNENDSNLNDFFSRSFYAYDENNKNKQKNIEDLMNLSKARTQVLEQHGFIEKEGNNIHLNTLGYMASKVRGYNAILLTEVLSNKKLSMITPEGLVSIAGLLANPVKSNEKELSLQPELGFIFDSVENHINNIRKELKSSISEKLRNLGHNFESFKSYDDMEDFVQKLKRPDMPSEELIADVKKYRQLNSKMYKIMKATGKYTPESLVEALKRNDVLPTKVLNNYIEIVEDYKKRIHCQSIDDYIEKLEYEINNSDSFAKGKKAKARSERKLDDVKKELNNAKNMKYLDENLMEALHKNHEFLKQNPPEYIRQKYMQAENNYTRYALKETLLSQVRGLKQIEEYMHANKISDNAAYDKTRVVNCVNDIITKSLKIREDEMNCGISTSLEKYGDKGIQILYNWAVMNKINSDSMSNWSELVNIAMDDDIDEGCIYQNIVRTADLLSQIKEMAEAGYESSETEEDKEYYKDMKKKASEARDLIIKDPMEI